MASQADLEVLVQLASQAPLATQATPVVLALRVSEDSKVLYSKFIDKIYNQTHTTTQIFSYLQTQSPMYSLLLLLACSFTYRDLMKHYFSQEAQETLAHQDRVASQAPLVHKDGLVQLDLKDRMALQDSLDQKEQLDFQVRSSTFLWHFSPS